MPDKPTPTPQPPPPQPVPPPEPLPPNPPPVPTDAVAALLPAAPEAERRRVRSAAPRGISTRAPPRPEAGDLQTGRKEKPQRRLDAPGPGGFAVIGAFGFQILKIIQKFPIFLDETIA